MLPHLGDMNPERPFRGFPKRFQERRIVDVVGFAVWRLDLDFEGISVRIDRVDTGCEPLESVEILWQQQIVAGFEAGFVQNELFLIPTGMPGEGRITICGDDAVDPVAHQAAERGVDMRDFMTPHPLHRIAPDALDRSQSHGTSSPFYGFPKIG